MSQCKTTLHIFSKQDVLLSDALTAWKEPLLDSIGLFYSIDKCHVLPFNKVCSWATSPPFEARIFNAKCELRWVATAKAFDVTAKDNKGDAIVLSEDDVKSTLKWNDTPCTYIEHKDLDYLLWGKVKDLAEETVTFFDHRIGALRIPAGAFGNKNPSADDYGVIKAREYIAAANDGNCFVTAERLCGLGIL